MTACAALRRDLDGLYPIVDPGLNIGKGPVVIGNVPEKSKGIVRRVCTYVEENVVNPLLQKYDLLRKKTSSVAGGDVPVYIKRLGADENGGPQAYTNGREIGLDESTVPETNLFYRLAERLAKYKGKSKIANYLYEKLKRPVDNLVHNLTHEGFHIHTQIGLEPDYPEYDGQNFISDLYHATKEHLAKKMPEYFAERLAEKVIIPIIEGLNQGMTYQAILGKDTNREIKEEARKDPTSYARLAEVSAVALDKTGEESPADFYRSYVKEGYKKAKNYVKKFMESLGDCFGPPKANACAYATI